MLHAIDLTNYFVMLKNALFKAGNVQVKDQCLCMALGSQTKVIQLLPLMQVLPNGSFGRVIPDSKVVRCL